VVHRRAGSPGAISAKFRRDATLYRMRLARLVPAPAIQRPANARIHREHRIEIDDLGMGKHFERMLQFMGEQRNQSVVIDARAVRRDHDAKVTTTGRGHDEWQQAAIEVAEGAMTEFDIDNAVRLRHPVEQSLERWRSRGSFLNQRRDDGIRGPDAGRLGAEDNCRGSAHETTRQT